jgi:two-component system CheB/CheR fusion protein
MSKQVKPNPDLANSPVEKQTARVTGDTVVNETPRTAGEMQHGNAFSIASSSNFRVVGLGASAGGLEALTQLFQSVPRDPGLAFILIQHLAPDHKSALVQLLKRHTSMLVAEAVDGAAVKSNCVYIIPPDRHLAIANGMLRLSPFAKSDGANMAIDFFFRSLADDQGSAAIGVVLSGAGTDGALGLKAIREAGGVTFAQDATSAKFPSMPLNAIESGCTDIVLTPAEIGKELVRVAATMIVEKTARKGDGNADANTQSALKQICLLLARQLGVDFTHYKHSTIARRIERRMLLLRLHRMENYVDHLRENPSEVDALYHDILINVTRFFRDAEVFDALKTVVFPAILKNRPSGLPIRVWVPGCSTGEEVYSIAICLIESMETAGVVFPVQIFGSDIDEPAITQARAGVFPVSICNDMSEERLNNFFVRVESGYQIKKYIRDHCIFSKQNLVKDPPFSNLDLISCRNLLIYLGPVLQKRAISVFHYALRPSGFLLLGTAEGIGGHADLFKLVDQKSRIHVKKSIATPLRLDFGHADSSLARDASVPAKEVGILAIANASVQREVDRLLLQKYSPPAVVVNEQLQILYFRGETAPYLQASPGEASLNLLKMARGNLMLELRIAMNKAMLEGTAVRREKIQFRENGRRSLVDLEVIPVSGTENPSACFLVVFEEAVAASGIPRKSVGEHEVESSEQHLITELMHELTATKEYLQSAIAQHDAISGELNSTSEELQSSNEELQSINEELESAKEELQSSNEELVTVNDELERRNLELTQVNNDLINLVDSASMPTVMVDRNLRIRRFTPQITGLLNLIPGDVGRPLSNIKINMAAVEFGQILGEVVDTGCRKELEAQDDFGCWYSVRFYPYKAADNSVDGAIVVFVDIDRIKRSFESARDARDFAEAVIAAVPRPLLVLDKDLRVVSVSRSYLEFFSVTEKDTVGNLLYYLGNGQWGIPKLRTALENTLANGVGFDEFIVQHQFEHIGEMQVKISGRYIVPGTSRPPLIYMQIER